MTPMSSDDVRLDLELAADAEIDRQLLDPQPILNNTGGMMAGNGYFPLGIQAVAFKNCTSQVSRGVFEARCVARGFAAHSVGSNLDDVYFSRGSNLWP